MLIDIFDFEYHLKVLVLGLRILDQMLKHELTSIIFLSLELIENINP